MGNSCYQELVKCETPDCTNMIRQNGFYNPKRVCKKCIENKKKIRQNERYESQVQISNIEEGAVLQVVLRTLLN